MPTEIRGYMYELLVELVLCYKEINDISHDLLQKTLQELVKMILSLIRSNLDDLPSLSNASVLQLFVEIEFFEITMKDYIMGGSRECLNKIKDLLSTNRSIPKQHWNAEKILLNDALKATGVQFICFTG